MNRDDDFIAQLEDYLETFDGVTPLPDRVRDAVRADLPGTRQQHARGPGRMLDMISRASTPARWGVAAAVAVVAIGLGLAFANAGRATPMVGTAPTQSPAPSSEVTASPVPALSNSAYTVACDPGGGTPLCLSPGTYRVADAWPRQVLIDVPAGWSEYQSAPDRNGVLVEHSDATQGSGWGVVFSAVGEVSKDPCDPTQGVLDAAETATVDGFLAAMRQWPGFEATPATDIMVGGLDGKLVELTSTLTPADCPDQVLWTTPRRGEVDAYPLVVHRGAYAVQSRVVDVDGTLLVIWTSDFPQTSPYELAYGVAADPDRHAADQVELRQIVDSIRFTPAP